MHVYTGLRTLFMPLYDATLHDLFWFPYRQYYSEHDSASYWITYIFHHGWSTHSPLLLSTSSVTTVALSFIQCTNVNNEFLCSMLNTHLPITVDTIVPLIQHGTMRYWTLRQRHSTLPFINTSSDDKHITEDNIFPRTSRRTSSYITLQLQHLPSSHR